MHRVFALTPHGGLYMSKLFSEYDTVSDDQAIPSPEEQLNIINALKTAPRPETYWYLISSSWTSRWVDFCRGQLKEGEVVGPICLRDLIHPDSGDIGFVCLKDGLVYERDFSAVPETLWNYLKKWYGLAPKTRPIVRPVIFDERGPEIDLPTIQYRLDKGPLKMMAILSDSTVSDLKQLFQKHLGDDDRDPRTFYSSSEEIYHEAHSFHIQREGQIRKSLGLEFDDVPLKDLDLFNTTAVLLVMKNIDFVNNDIDDDGPARERWPQVRFDSKSGLWGIYNLGNTCFMNSALQCLSNCKPLTLFFLEGHHLAQLNRENPLGTGGILAEAYGHLLRELWSCSKSSTINGHSLRSNDTAVDPSRFKAMLGRFESRFLGYHQQDSQEFLSALLDRIHEDVNRVHEKPYIELPDYEGQEEHLFAQESWNLHVKRNDSIIVDNFHGQFRSRVKCLTCGHSSLTFDPFLFLSLPIPAEKESLVEVQLIKGASVIPMRFALEKSQRRVADLLAMISKETQIPKESLVAAEIYNHEVYRTFNDDHNIDLLRGSVDDFYVYHVEGPHSRWVSFRLKDSSGFLPSYVGFPLIISYTEDHEIMDRIQQLLRLIFAMTESSLDVDLFEWESIAKIEKDLIIGPECRFGGYLVTFNEDYLEKQLHLDVHSILDSLNSRSKAVESHQYSRLRYTNASLKHCIDLFTEEEHLSGMELWYCPKCKEHRHATKKMDLWRLPNILILHLKRFSYGHRGEKIRANIEFPLENLDLSSYLPKHPENDHEQPIYDLFAVSHHFGGLGGGHYTASAKNFFNNQWYNFDDSHASLISFSPSSAGESAYLLCYQRKSSSLE